METKIDTTEMSNIKRQVTTVAGKAEEMIIKNDQNYLDATDVLTKIKTIGKVIKDKKEEITSPLNMALKAARDLFRPLEDQWATAETIIKQKMIAYRQEQQRIADEQEAKIAKQVDSGRLSFNRGAEKIAEIKRMDATVSGKVGSATVKKIKKFKISNESILPRQYLIPNLTLIREDAVLKGVVIPGVEVYEEEILASSYGKNY